MITVFGSINLDLISRLDELPRPGETRLAHAFRTEPGGKGANQAFAAARDGATVALFGAVGRDPFAAAALGGLRQAGVDLAGVAEVDAPTGVASIWTDAAGRNSIAVAAGANLHAGQASVPDWALGPEAIVLIQMECDPAETAALIFRAHARGARVVLNLAPAADLPLEALRRLHLLVVNEQEAEFVAGRLGVAPDAAAIGRALGIGVVRTLGEAGSEALFDGALQTVAAHRVTVVDTTAAGDCFVGVMAAALDRGADLRAALERASVAAALACSRAGSQATAPTAAETDGVLRGRN